MDIDIISQGYIDIDDSIFFLTLIASYSVFRYLYNHFRFVSELFFFQDLSPKSDKIHSHLWVRYNTHTCPMFILLQKIKVSDADDDLYLLFI
jgi:hypothetical protein